MDIKQSFTFAFAAASVAHRNLLERLMDEIGLHAGQVFVLNELWETDGQSQAELAKRLGVSAPTITKMVTSLAYSSFVETRKTLEDGRLSRVYLTKKGKVIRPLVMAQWEKLERIVLTGFSNDENAVLLSFVDRLQENFRL